MVSTLWGVPFCFMHVLVNTCLQISRDHSQWAIYIHVSETCTYIAHFVTPAEVYIVYISHIVCVTPAEVNGKHKIYNTTINK